jgi:Fe-S-cluster containining protein
MKKCEPLFSSSMIGTDMTLQELWHAIDGLVQSCSIVCSRLDTCNMACCRAGISGVIPCVTRNEMNAIRDFLKMRALSLPPFNVNQCRFFSEDGKCLVYEARPIGCRGYFCANDNYDAVRLPSSYGEQLSRYLETNSLENETIEIRIADFKNIERNNWS